MRPIKTDESASQKTITSTSSSNELQPTTTHLGKQ